MADDYQIVPQKDFDILKRDVDRIKKDPVGATAEGKALKESVDRLNDSINMLFNMFKATADTMKLEEHDNSLVSQRIGPLFDRITRLESQNEKIAKGIVALAEMLEDIKANKKNIGQAKDETKSSFDTPPPFNLPQQAPPQPPQIIPPWQQQTPQQPDFSFGLPPPTEGPQPLPRMQMPPPPPMQPQKKRGLFGR